ncbi:hypothetical protein OEZ86_014385 [Tetradesmus obliquus]|nr:hypothetical protein OEZ86_014385 [Tetradesmus obliquus]
MEKYLKTFDASASINQATEAVLGVLMHKQGKAAAQHADVLCDYLLQLTVMAGKEAGAAAAAAAAAARGNLSLLLAHLLAAVTLSSHPSAVQQVVARAAASLPDALKQC